MSAWNVALAVAGFSLAVGMAGHALLHKRDSRSALGWVAVCLTFPVAGPLLYYIFGINRVRRSALRMREEAGAPSSHVHTEGSRSIAGAVDELHIPPRYRELERVGRAMTGRPLCGGNCMEPLYNGEEAYPSMLEAIDNASDRLYLCTYIFETGEIGRQFITALQRAHQRGVDVRVIIDGAGEKYSWPRASSLLKKASVPFAVFLPPRIFPPRLTINLRTHRKLLVADGKIAFTGGMNIGRRHMAYTANNSRITDVHFRIMGPVAEQMEQVFLDDWRFVTGRDDRPSGVPEQCEGDCLCRVVVDGPDNEKDPLESTLLGVVSSARRSIRLMTPYFIPSREFISALQAAELRGVDVRIILPEKNNLPFVKWATQNMLWQLLGRDIRVFYQPAPFCHSKLLIVDGVYVHLGSANIDPRSLRLNFELTLEVMDVHMGRKMARHFDAVQRKSREVFLQEVDSRPLLVHIRDALFWLFSPYL